MKIEDIKGVLGYFELAVEVRSTKELFPFAAEGAVPTHFSIVCQSHADQYRVHHWIQFSRARFEGFDCWAAYVEAITDSGPYNSPKRHLGTLPPLPKLTNLNLPPGVYC